MTELTTEVATSADVELRLPADGAYVSLLRTLASGLAARLDFTMDDIEDLRIAVSEAAAMVLEHARGGATLDCRFTQTDHGLVVTVATTTGGATEPDYESFGWQVLATLADEASIDAGRSTYAVRFAVHSALAAGPSI